MSKVEGRRNHAMSKTILVDHPMNEVVSLYPKHLGILREVHNSNLHVV